MIKLFICISLIILAAITTKILVTSIVLKLLMLLVLSIVSAVVIFKTFKSE